MFAKHIRQRRGSGFQVSSSGRERTLHLYLKLGRNSELVFPRKNPSLGWERDFPVLLSGLSHKFLYIFIVPVQLLPSVGLREFPLDGRLVLVALRRPGEHFTA